jgi:hypothetical protein
MENNGNGNQHERKYESNGENVASINESVAWRRNRKSAAKWRSENSENNGENQRKKMAAA